MACASRRTSTVMSTGSSRHYHDWQNLYRQIWRLERQLETANGNYHGIGHDGWPDHELVRFKTSQHMGFAGQDIADATFSRNDDGLMQATMAINTLGLTGARGALPSHYTEWVLQQLKARAPELRDFLDIFNHRILSLLYRSWEKTQPSVQQERQQQDIFTTILQTLSGSTEHWQQMYSGAQQRSACSATTLCHALEDMTGIKAQLTPLQGGWKPVAASEQTQLPSRRKKRGQYARLGEAMLGSKAWLADLGTIITFFPETSQQVASLLPGGQYSAGIAKLVSRLAGNQLQVKYRMRAAAKNLTGTQLGVTGQLGQNSFTAVSARNNNVLTLSFKPRKG